MDPTRIRYILKRNWPALLITALIGAAVGALVTAYSNDRIKPRFSAVAATSFEEATIGLPGEAEVLLNQALAIALEANQDHLLNQPESRAIEINDDLLQLEFTATAPTRADAEQLAAEMRQNYISGPQDREGVLRAELEATLSEMRQVADVLNGLEESSTATDALELQLINDQMAALQTQVTTLRLELLFPEERSTSEVQADLTRAMAALDDLVVRRSQLAPAEARPFSEEGVVRRTAEAEFEALEERYQEIVLQLSRAATPTTVDIVVTDVTAAPGDTTVNAMIGLGISVLLSVSFLLLIDRIRQPVLTSTDLLPSVRGLGTIPARIDHDPSRVWYTTSNEAARKTSIQALRAAVSGGGHLRKATIAFTGLDVSSERMHALTADFAVSMTMTEQRVMLVDADFDEGGTGAEYVSHGVTLSNLISDPSEMLVDLKKGDVDGLYTLPVGNTPIDANEAVVGPRMTRLMERAPQNVDMAVVVLPDVSRPVAKTLLSQINYGVLVLTPNETSTTEVLNAVNDWGPSGAQLLGYVLLERRPAWRSLQNRLLRRRSRPGDAHLPPVEPAMPQTPADRALTQSRPASTEPVDQPTTARSDPSEAEAERVPSRFDPAAMMDRADQMRAKNISPPPRRPD
jgi:Mrp family chromosome partitioning ATPase